MLLLCSLTCTQLEYLAYEEWKERGLLFDCSRRHHLFNVTGFEDTRVKIPLGEWPSGTSYVRQTLTILVKYSARRARVAAARSWRLLSHTLVKRDRVGRAELPKAALAEFDTFIMERRLFVRG